MEKPDFEKLADRKCPPKAYPEAWGGFVAACEHVWNTHVAPLQSRIEELEKQLNEKSRNSTFNTGDS